MIFEGRFLVNLAGAVIRQDTIRPIHGAINWEMMYRTADYHRIANLIYLGLMGKRETVPERWRERFFDRYQEALRFGDICNEAEREILTLLEMKEISCIILASCGIRDLYQVKEMAGNSPLILYLDNESYTLVKGYLIDLGYETDKTFPDCGECMKKVSGFTVEIYHDLPFITSTYKKHMQHLLERSVPRNSSQRIRNLTVQDRFVFRMAQAVYHYVTNELLLREVLDLYLFHKAWQSRLDHETIMDMLAALHIEELAEKLLYISYMWFGSKEDSGIERPDENLEVYDVLENRILSRGAIEKETDPQALELGSMIERVLAKERKKEKLGSIKDRLLSQWRNLKRSLHWVFPEYQYMCAIYPWLEKLPILLPIGWMIRDLRLLLGMLRSRFRFKSEQKASDDHPDS